MTLVKICGVTSLDDARAAVAAGADMLGFNFYRASPRYIEPSAVRTIIDSLCAETTDETITTIGVFVNEASPEAVNEIVTESGVGGVQLHGDESVELCQGLKQLLNGRLLIKVLRVPKGFDPGEMQQYDADAIMLDSFHGELRGGTGQVVDWNVARSVRDFVPRLFLAGGLSPANVAEAILKVDPYAVDACSSLESAPGRKDAARMKAFVEAVRNG